MPKSGQKNDPLRQHVIPRCYLEWFARDGLVWVLDRSTGELREQAPKTTSISKNFYTFVDDGGNNRYDLERLLGQIEGDAKPVIAKLNSRENLSADEKESLCWFLAFAHTRTVGFHRGVENMYQRVAMVAGDAAFGTVERARETMAAAAARGEPHQSTPEEMAEFVRSGKFSLEVHRNASIESMMALTDKIAHWFLNMDWVVWHAPERTSFITTDNPIVLAPTFPVNPRMGVGILTPGVMKMFPLSHSASLAMYDQGKHFTHRDLDPATVRNANFGFAGKGDRWIVARDEALLNSIARKLSRGAKL